MEGGTKMPGPADYFIGAGASVGQALAPVQKYVQGKQPLTPMQEDLANYYRRIMAGEDPDALSIEYRAKKQGVWQVQDSPAQAAPAPQAPPPVAEAPHTQMSMAPGSEGGLSAQAMAMANQIPQGVGQPLAQQAQALGAPPPAPAPAPVVNNDIARASAAPASLVQKPSFRMPTNQEEFGQMEAGMKSIADFRPKGLSLEERQALLEHRVRTEDPGKNQRAALMSTTRKEVAQTQATTAKEVAEVKEKGATDRTKMTVEQKRESDANKLKQDKEEAEDLAKYRKNLTDLAKARFAEAKKDKTSKGRNEARADLIKYIGDLRRSATTNRKPDALGGQNEENMKKAKEDEAQIQALIGPLERELRAQFGPDAVKEMRAYSEEGISPEATESPGGMSVQPSPTQRYMVEPPPLDTSGAVSPGDMTGSDMGAPPMPVKGDVSEPEARYKRAPDGSIWVKDRSGVRRVV